MDDNVWFIDVEESCEMSVADALAWCHEVGACVTFSPNRVSISVSQYASAGGAPLEASGQGQDIVAAVTATKAEWERRDELCTAAFQAGRAARNHHQHQPPPTLEWYAHNAWQTGWCRRDEELAREADAANV